MTVTDITQALLDNDVFLKLAKRSGVTPAQARAFLAELGELPVRQAIRMTKTAHDDRVRQINSQTRKGARR